MISTNSSLSSSRVGISSSEPAEEVAEEESSDVEELQDVEESQDEREPSELSSERASEEEPPGMPRPPDSGSRRFPEPPDEDEAVPEEVPEALESRLPEPSSEVPDVELSRNPPLRCFFDVFFRDFESVRPPDPWLPASPDCSRGSCEKLPATDEESSERPDSSEPSERKERVIRESASLKDIIRAPDRNARSGTLALADVFEVSLMLRDTFCEISRVSGETSTRSLSPSEKTQAQSSDPPLSPETLSPERFLLLPAVAS